MLVVGGGDSALEAALALAERPGATVTLSYRGAAFSRARAANRERLVAAERNGRVALMLESAVVRIGEAEMVLAHGGAEHTLGNDAVIVCAGGVLATEWLKQIGIEVETKYGTV